ncbi:hypothetical protein VFPBJ_11307 [Purpureocillium lilacinum]|uniref:Uncharacterized protein n=1 Tax=Purpureocillium lilacinum TaxID=33203 RepID=A0A179FDZ4_PURLI|nr:hypothetical protein VFPBJ_11307 [Purpureocillium lilacinum]
MKSQARYICDSALRGYTADCCSHRPISNLASSKALYSWPLERINFGYASRIPDSNCQQRPEWFEWMCSTLTYSAEQLETSQCTQADGAGVYLRSTAGRRQPYTSSVRYAVNAIPTMNTESMDQRGVSFTEEFGTTNSIPYIPDHATRPDHLGGLFAKGVGQIESPPKLKFSNSSLVEYRRPTRGPFLDIELRQQTAETRRIGSCIRCKMQRIRVSNPWQKYLAWVSLCASTSERLMWYVPVQGRPERTRGHLPELLSIAELTVSTKLSMHEA